MKYNLGLFHGRFEHIHKGHQKIINQMLKECKKCVLLVGNCQALRTEKNPFTILERINLIRKVYKNKKNFIVGFFPDLPYVPKTRKQYEKWGDWILGFCNYYAGASPNVVYSGDEAKTELLYGKKKIKLVKIPREELPISATKIKDLLKQNKKTEWKSITDKKIHSEYNKLRKIVLSIPKKK